MPRGQNSQIVKSVPLQSPKFKDFGFFLRGGDFFETRAGGAVNAGLALGPGGVTLELAVDQADIESSGLAF